MDYYKGNLGSTDTTGYEHKMPFSLPYRQHAHSPFFGAPNSQANFCEEDYIITPYIAEFVNTLTNLTYLFYAYHGIKSNSNRSDAILRNLPYLGIAAVGLGSGIFHSTLKNYTQWGDDLSMLVATATVIHRVFTYNKSLNYTVIYGALLFSIMAAFSIWHCVTDELFMHSILFGVMIVIVGYKTRAVIKTRVTDPIVRKDVKLLAAVGAVTFAGGFGIWNLDIMFCSTLTEWKRTIGMPWSFILELHGWWHILTGLGAYIFIALVEYLTSEEAGQPLGSRFAWPVGYIISTRGKTPSLNASKYASELNTSANRALKKVNGVGTPKHANSTTDVSALFGVKDLKTS